MRKFLTNEEAIKKLSLNNSNIIFLDKYYSSKDKSHFKCLICNCDWKAVAVGVINGKNGCPECGKKKVIQTIKHNITTDDFKNKIKKKFNDKLNIIGEYINIETKIKVNCNICGYNWISKPKYLISGYGCVKCGNIEKGKKHRKSNETFLNEIYNIYNDRMTILEKYKDCRNRIKVKCNVCDYEWNPISRRLLYRGCPKCNFSKGELLISNILKDLNLNFKEQYIFEGLKTDMNGTPIFDFVIFNEINNIKCILEYDGEQHFKPAKKWGGEKRFKRQLEIDEFKKLYKI